MPLSPKHILIYIAIILVVVSFFWPGPLLQVAVLLLAISMLVP